MSALELSEPSSTAVSLLAAAASLVMVTLLVAWALEEVVYFSLFIGIPAGMASAAVIYVLVKRNLRAPG